MNYSILSLKVIPSPERLTGVSRFSLITSLFVFSLLSSSCKKEEATISLPPITRNGANTFGAVMNGKIYSIKGASNFSGGLYADLQEDSCDNCFLPPDSADLYIRINGEGNDCFKIFLTDPRSTKEWRLNQPTRDFWDLGKNKIKAYIQHQDFRTGLTTDGHIRSDFYSRDDGIFSAEFSFHCINPKTCQETSLTDGRIDVNLNSISYLP
jgi:hypothetical protein